jgi:hypothetical protein
MADDNELEIAELALERDKLAFEREKFKDTQKLEYRKAWALCIPLAVAALTVVYSVYSSNIDARNNFELKATEIIMNSQGPLETYHKAHALKALFGDDLPHEFANDFNPGNEMLGSPVVAGDKIEFLKLIIQNPNYNKSEIIELWGEVYPADRPWLSKIKTDSDIIWGKSAISNLPSPQYNRTD